MSRAGDCFSDESMSPDDQRECVTAVSYALEEELERVTAERDALLALPDVSRDELAKDLCEAYGEAWRFVTDTDPNATCDVDGYTGTSGAVMSSMPCWRRGGWCGVTERVAVRDAARGVLADVVRQYQLAWSADWTPSMLVRSFADGQLGANGGGVQWSWGRGVRWDLEQNVIRCKWNSKQCAVTQLNGELCCEVFTIAEIAAAVEGTAAGESVRQRVEQERV